MGAARLASRRPHQAMGLVSGHTEWHERVSFASERLTAQRDLPGNGGALHRCLTGPRGSLAFNCWAADNHSAMRACNEEVVIFAGGRAGAACANVPARDPSLVRGGRSECV